MAQVNLGRIGFVNKGTYDSASTYKLNDVVLYDGIVYAAIQEVPAGVLPTDVGYWQKWTFTLDIIDDTVSITTKTWSSTKIQNELNQYEVFITSTPIIVLNNTVNEGATAGGTISNYEAEANYFFSANLGTVSYTSGSTFDYTAPSGLSENETDTVYCYATKVGELRSAITQRDVTVVFVPIVADDAISLDSFQDSEETNIGWEY
jgi:hypothetical protein